MSKTKHTDPTREQGPKKPIAAKGAGQPRASLPIPTAGRSKSTAVSPTTTPAVPMFRWRTFDPAEIPIDGEYSFRDELTTYRDHLDDLLEHEGKYVVIKGCDVVGVFPERDQALLAAIEKFGEEPALVKQIVSEEPFVILGHAAL